MKVFELVGEITVKIGEAVKNLKKTEDAAEDTADELRELGDSGEKSTDKVVNGLTKAGRTFENVFKKSTSIKETRTSLKELTDTVEKQESKLTELKNKYIQLYHSQGETSDEARETASEISKLSKSLKENKSKLTEAEKAADKFDETLEDAGDSADEVQSKMTGAFAKIGSAVAAAFAIDKIKDFANACVEASAEVSAEVSAFEQIMGDYSDEASAKMQKVADDTGIVNSRLTPYMTSLTAKFKGLGYGIDEATTLASDGLSLAADAAAFWDKSLDDSMGALNSFINGSYEGGEAIGLFANDTQMASYAVKEGIVKETKEWSNLDEARKQATRLEYAQAMMKASGAVGQASKESGQYANVQANLTEKWRQFKAQIGEPILQNIVIPAMSKLSGVIDTLSAGFQAASKWCSEHKTALQLIGIAAATLAAAIGAYTIAQNAAAIATAISTAATTAFGTVMAFVTSPITLVVLAIGALVAGFLYLWNTSEGFRSFWINLWEKIKSAVSGAVDWLKNAWNSIKDAFNSTIEFFTSAVDAIKSAWNSVTVFFEDIWNGICDGVSNLVNQVIGFFRSIANWIEINIITPISQFWNTWIQPIIDKLIEMHLKIIEIITALFIGLKNLFMIFWTSIVQWLQSIWNKIIEIFSVCATWVDENIISPISAAIKAFIDAVINFFTVLWNRIVSIFMTVYSWVKNNIIIPVYTAITSFFSMILGIAKNAWNGIKNVFLTVGGFFKNVFQSAYNAVTSIFNKIGSFFGTLWNKIKNTFVKLGTNISDAIGKAVKAGLNGVISAIERTINRGVSLINSAINLINLLPGVSVGKISEIKLPRLAKGGVLERGQVGLLEGEGAEAVVPLDQNLKWLDRLKMLLAPIVTASMEALTTSIPEYGGITSTNVFANNNSDIAELLTRILRLLESMDKTLYDKIVTALTEGVTLDVDGREVARVIRKYA